MELVWCLGVNCSTVLVPLQQRISCQSTPIDISDVWVDGFPWIGECALGSMESAVCGDGTSDLLKLSNYESFKSIFFILDLVQSTACLHKYFVPANTLLWTFTTPWPLTYQAVSVQKKRLPDLAQTLVDHYIWDSPGLVKIRLRFPKFPAVS